LLWETPKATNGVFSHFFSESTKAQAITSIPNTNQLTELSRFVRRQDNLTEICRENIDSKAKLSKE